VNDLKDFKKEAGRRIPQVEAELDDLDIEDIEGGRPTCPFLEAAGQQSGLLQDPKCCCPTAGEG
jgi:hypothetical protein